MKYYLRSIIAGSVTAASLLMTGCNGNHHDEDIVSSLYGEGLFICNEGQFQYGNASLSFYSPDDDQVTNDVFVRANGYKLGELAQSMTIAGGRGWIVVNNSGIVFAVDPSTAVEKGRITGLTSPRYFHMVSDSKAYITQMYDNRIVIVDPQRYEITGYIEVPGMTPESGSTEQMVSDGKYVYCNCWSYQNRIIRIDTETDRVVAELEVGIQPQSLVMDRNHKLWTLTDGGYEGSPYGYEAPRLHRIDPATLTVEQEFTFPLGSYVSELQLNGDGTELYWLNGDVWRMSVTATALPASPAVLSQSTYFYGLTVDPSNGDVYVADAIDFSQPGMIYRFDKSGRKIASFTVGVAPGAFCWSKTGK